ncbi:helix-turn-helix transcriptional regulator [Saccharopolyspora gloriosae]|uniref:Transcriptional regulator with XRE-family HTH domain n=1 Tax=Saccharopolyspora gloriosae TaxID=455344 RepID=A0A840NJU5_9PSEU|nr:helix-turn-helix transcriptional regulator [Saccharopolyspora gloriosae]MBB5070578.1 transcriptional regulator with XRE-family HTH domain [Saccharopolyspora gloriosae]
MSAKDPQVVLIQLGILLRRLRETQRLTAAVAADHLGCSTAKISKMENGRQSIKSDEVGKLLELYQANDSQAAEALRLAAVPTPRRRGTYRDNVPDWFRRFLVLESEASALTIYENELIAGILQCEEYARTVLTAGYPFASRQELDSQVEVRLRRRDVLMKADAPHVDVILHEATLHRVIGDDLIMRQQLGLLEELVALPNLELRILPFRPSPSAGTDGAFMAKSAFVVLQLESTGAVVYVEDIAGANYPEEAAVIEAHANAYRRLRNVALTPDQSRELIGKVKSQYR